MSKSESAAAVDEIQRKLRPLLAARGFKVRGRTFNRLNDDGLTEVVNIQMGASDPPGTTYIPGLRHNMHGLFTINLGVHVPEVARWHQRTEPKAWVQDSYCCIRTRLGELTPERKDIWWRCIAEPPVIDDVIGLLNKLGFPFLERFESRDKILSEWQNASENMGASSPPRIVMAIILIGRGEKDRAKELLVKQAQETRNPHHPKYVRSLAEALGVPIGG